MSEQRLGILGGMGPQATQDFYQRILDRTDASCDQEHLPTLIWSDTSMPDRTAAILGGDAEGCYRRLLDGARLLERGGCTALAIPCNTARFFPSAASTPTVSRGMWMRGMAISPWRRSAK